MSPSPHTLSVPPPDIVRSAYVDLVVADLARARAFYVDLLGLIVTKETEDAIYLRTFEEFIHHNVVLRQGPQPGAAAFGYRVRTPEDVDRAEAFFAALGCRVKRARDGFVDGIGDAVRVEDPLGFTDEFFYQTDHVDRLTWRYDLHCATPLARLDHINLVTPRVQEGCDFLAALGFRITEDIRDGDGVTYAAWLGRKQTVHDTALTGGDGPRMHHLAFSTYESHHVLALCDRLGALSQTSAIERGPGRHGVSNAFYLYLRDPDGHRVEIYTHDYYTGDPDNPRITWDVTDERRRDWWANPVVPRWYSEASSVLDLDGIPRPLDIREEPREERVVVGADGFTVDTATDQETKIGSQL
ncbi:3,4-dihydroxyphenylacetate 2,3-dioxygenase [Calidifontibacter sp. DB0510]|uniref:3,4-dihydroxyphenylacetate 2,3-dioxygenase n=1 Tax=Metallococcus carri TaxID=1656884 RepID=A0A967EG85_9MICO|nr:3,4-dihydroxyphenylacetate 2,3-dioxygenase [Metallococcus carri]NHN54753.1 3,4-dihydroxyphenylacetate 2,3-dioxygenase [Metallococcus carri]NOP37098.1 3,4-dihydroxyphenylacetate 2,3-dioxygenase [Calidifontibacter sp. DB2511S]